MTDENGSTHHVLVIEDDPNLLMLLLTVVRSIAKFTAVGASTIGEAQAKLGDPTATYPLILLDRNLPDGDGTDFCRALRAQGSLARIIILSGEDSEKTMLRAFDAGASSYLVKPVSVAALIEAVESGMQPNQHPSTVLFAK